MAVAVSNIILMKNGKMKILFININAGEKTNVRFIRCHNARNNFCLNE